jgi:hypothetical protein
LTKSYLINYLNYNNQTAVILLWNDSSMDKNILFGLGINNIIINIIIINNNKIISNHKLSHINKNGKFLSL